uniref:Uncharacterized protein n=1 Tax=Salix viminalis TaxID=40686 RepID=A0A6N2LCE5_SALVM
MAYGLGRAAAAFEISKDLKEDDIMIDPAEVLVNASNPPVFRAFQYIEFLRNYMTKTDINDDALEHFKL